MRIVTGGTIVIVQVLQVVVKEALPSPAQIPMDLGVQVVDPVVTAYHVS